MGKRLLFAIGLMGLVLLSSPHPARAANLLNGVDCSRAAGSSVCTDNTGKDPLTGQHGALISITNIIAFAAGLAAVAMIMLAAIRFTLSGSDISTNSRTDTDVENARHTIVNALIGLAVIALSRILILFVLQRI